MVHFLALAALASCHATRSALDKPNVIMLFVDDLGYGDLGFNGHPTTQTPNIDGLAHGGKILTSWYSGCPVCSGSRAALMTGRQFNRVGVPGVFGPDVQTGLPLNETTAGQQMKKAGYATAVMGKWHLGQREMYLPGARGFDYYLGIPYSDDMGEARATPCSSDPNAVTKQAPMILNDDWTAGYEALGLYNADAQFANSGDPGASLLPLVYQDAANQTTSVLEQPLDFTHLAEKYNAFVTGFIQAHATVPFFLYMPFSHVHTTSSNQPDMQYAGCNFKNATKRGAFGDALAEVDWIVGNVVEELKTATITENTLIMFTGDNGPWMVKGKSGGSEGLLTGITAGYWNTGKGATWEGGMHEAAFAYWPGQIAPNSRSSEVTSSMDVFPTISALAGVALPTDRVYDGRDMSALLLDTTGTVKSSHEFLYFYGGCAKSGSPSAVRYGAYKAYWCTSPGLGGCSLPTCSSVQYPAPVPLLFNLWEDPSEAYPLTPAHPNATGYLLDPVVQQVLDDINTALAKELATFTHGTLIPAPNVPSEKQPDGSYLYAICCDRTKGCDCDGKPKTDPYAAAAQQTANGPWFADLGLPNIVKTY